MIKCLLCILHLLLILISSQLLYAQNSMQRVRINSIYEHASSYPGPGDYKYEYYHYGSSSFYSLDSTYTIRDEDSYPTFCQTQITQNSQSISIDTYFQPLPNPYDSPYRTITIKDFYDRNIAYKYYNQNNSLIYNEEIYYSIHIQPDSVIINSEKWVYHFDNLGRKHTIDHYNLATTNWIYDGYYLLSYTEPLPITLTLTPAIIGLQDLALFDATWIFDRIIFHPLQGEADSLEWQVTNTNPIEFSNYVTNAWGMFELTSYSFDNTGMLHVYSYNFDNSYGNGSTYNWDIIVHNIDEIMPTSSVTLYQNYPNPFSTSTSIKYSLKNPGKTILNIYNTKGQLVKSLLNERKKAGSYTIIWSGDGDNGFPLASGMYFARLQSGNDIKTTKLILLR